MGGGLRISFLARRRVFGSVLDKNIEPNYF